VCNVVLIAHHAVILLFLAYTHVHLVLCLLLLLLLILHAVVAHRIVQPSATLVAHYGHHVCPMESYRCRR